MFKVPRKRQQRRPASHFTCLSTFWSILYTDRKPPKANLSTDPLYKPHLHNFSNPTPQNFSLHLKFYSYLMATKQLLSLSQKPMPTSSYGDRRRTTLQSLHRRTCSREQNDAAVDEKLWNDRLQRRRRCEDVRLLGFKYLADSVSGMIMKKGKAICRRIFTDFVKRTPRVGNEVMLVDPYFSVPVIPATVSSTPYLYHIQ